MKARVAAPGVIVKTRPRDAPPATCKRSASRAQGVKGTRRDVPFFVSGRYITPRTRSTCSLRIAQISERRIAVSTARVIIVGNSTERVASTIHCSSSRGQWISSTPRRRIRSNKRRSLESLTVGRRTSSRGLASSFIPQSLRKTVKTCERNARRRTTVAAALWESHSSRIGMRSVFRIRSTGRPESRVAIHDFAMEASVAAPFFAGEASVRYLAIAWASVGTGGRRRRLGFIKAASMAR